MFSAIKNLRSQDVFAVPKPWKVWQDYPTPERIKTKDQAKRWRSQVTTNHVFLSAYSGLNEHLRISQNSKRQEAANPPAQMVGFIADYDAACTDVQVANVSASPASPNNLPSFICDSFSPGQKRLIWLFEKPLLLGGNYSAARAFAQEFCKRVRVSLWLPGFDEKSLEPHMYFDIGTNWQPVEGGAPIPHHILSAWAVASDSKVAFTTESLSPPCLEKIAELVSSEYPGRWSGEFSLGARGVRFWDPQADNSTAAVVMEEGMRCFTGPSGFVTWREIFGAAAVDDLNSQVEGYLRDRVAFDDNSRKYFYEYDGQWLSADRRDFTDFLVSRGMDNRKPKKGGLSPAASFMELVRSKYRVDYALPFVYRKPGRITYNNRPYVNTSTVKVMPPAPALVDSEMSFHKAGEKSFPWLTAFLSDFFMPARGRPAWVPDSIPHKYVQLYHFLAWHYRFYRSAYLQDPLQGQAIFIGGPPSAGKGLFSNGFLGAASGGFSDASEYLLGEGQFTADAVNSGLMVVDDDHSGEDIKSHQAFTNRLKRLVANTQVRYNKKYGAAGNASWGGRVVVTFNLDFKSLRVLPDMSKSNADKIMLFLARERPKDSPLPDLIEAREILSRELPYYLRWLLDWKVPEWVLTGDNRFWVHPYHHPSLLESASNQGPVVNVLEMLRETYDELVENSDDDVLMRRGISAQLEDGKPIFKWSGPTRRLWKTMKLMDISHIDRLSFQQLGNVLGVLSDRGFRIKQTGENWQIVFDESLLTSRITHDVIAKERPDDG